MSIKLPYHRIFRPLKEYVRNGSCFRYSYSGYLIDHDYADHPEHYLRSYSIIQSDVIKLFETIEPADINNNTYSFRIYELLLRICTEVEANFKAILRENTYTPLNKKGELIDEKRWKLRDYKKVNSSHHLDGYKIELPYWSGENSKIRQPFKEFKNEDTLEWYSAYNNLKHNRINSFPSANFNNLINALCGLNVLLYSQFGKEDFDTGETLLSVKTDSYFKGNFSIGGYLLIEEPNDWLQNELYDFDWQTLKKEEIKFEKYNYNLIN